MQGLVTRKGGSFKYTGCDMKSNYYIALEVLQGKWGNGTERRERLSTAGYDYTAVQSIVNALVKDGFIPPAENSAPTQQNSTPDQQNGDLLVIDFNPKQYKGIQVNILI